MWRVGYPGVETFGTDEAGNLYIGMITFMIVGLTNVFLLCYIQHLCYKCSINSNWLMEEILKCMDCLQSVGYNVRARASANHPSNVAAYQKLLLKYTMGSNDDLRICINGKPICLFHDAVHIIKNIRNNLLNRKRLLFSPFSSDSLKDFPVEVIGGEITRHYCIKCMRKISKVW